MTQDQDNIRTMFQTTLAYLDTNNAIWNGITAFADAVTRAKSGVQAINTAADSQQTPTTGVTEDKAQARIDLEDKTLAVADQLSALSVKNNDNDLSAQVEMTKSSLDKMQDTDLEQTAERVAALANSNIAALAGYGVTAADVTELKNLVTAFAEMKTAPREKAADRKAQTVSIPQLIANVRSIFRNEIDKMMTPFRKSNADFYNGYFAARVIVDRAAGRTTAAKKPAASKTKAAFTAATSPEASPAS